ncbi:MAG: hypothetical protein J6S67_06835 [Methanobrevibacter sp.]|nr:hypothetical protein [Methanobrevibacter sp.]
MGLGLFLTGVLALMSGAIGWESQKKTDEEVVDQLDKQKDKLDADYLLQKDNAADKFAQAKEEAGRNAEKMNKQAELTDLSTNIAENTVSNDINTAIDNLYLNQASDAYSWNNAAMQIGSSEGASYAGLAGSGIRAGSSLSDAVMMESATNANQLQFSQEAKRRSDNNNLASVLNGIAGNKVNILGNRIGADQNRSDSLYLVNSFLEGGHEYNQYQNQLKQLKTDYDFNLGQIKNEKEKHTGDNARANRLAAFFTGATKGLSTSYNLYQMGKNL